jgi:hypothetical protein
LDSVVVAQLPAGDDVERSPVNAGVPRARRLPEPVAAAQVVAAIERGAIGSVELASATSVRMFTTAPWCCVRAGANARVVFNTPKKLTSKF